MGGKPSERTRQINFKCYNGEKERFHGINLRHVFHKYYSQDLDNYIPSIETYIKFHLCNNASLLMSVMYHLHHGKITEQEALIITGNHELTEEDKKYIKESFEDWCKRSKTYDAYLNRKRKTF